MLNIINTENVMMFIFMAFIAVIISIPIFYFLKQVFSYGDKTEKTIIIGASILTTIIIIL